MQIGTSTYVGAGLPKWVEVSWRRPIHAKKFIPTTGNTIDTLDFGEKLGDYRIPIEGRIPADTLKYASQGKGRVLALLFRILDEDVLLAWQVQEPSTKGSGYLTSHRGGEFLPAEIYNGQLVKKGWYLDKKTGQRRETDS